MEVSTRPNHQFTHSGKCVAARDLDLDMWLHNSKLRFEVSSLNGSDFPHQPSGALQEIISFVISHNMVLVMQRSQFIVILSAISLS